MVGLGIVLDYYLSLEREGMDLHVLHSVIELGKDLKRRSLTAKEVKVVLQVLKGLEADGMSLDKLMTAFELVSQLRERGVPPDIEHCESAVSLAVRLLASDIPLSEIEQWLMTRTRSSSKRLASGAWQNGRRGTKLSLGARTVSDVRQISTWTIGPRH
jgi:hypothetical protein